jgi:hypothetical protein
MTLADLAGFFSDPTARDDMKRRAVTLAQLGARGFTTGLLGAPVDLANMAMGGAGGERPVMGGEWIGQKLQGMGLLSPPAQDAAGAATEFAGGLLNPGGAAKAAAVKGPALAALLFHGSPHKFDKFDMSKIGTGEGAQAYGHGLYFAENPKVAQEYARMVKPETMSVQRENGKWDALVLGPNTKPHAEKSGFANQAEADKWADSVASQWGKGKVYKADVPDEAIGKMLDWDKPLSQQPGTMAAFRKAREAAGMKNDYWTPGKLATGSSEYQKMVSVVGQAKASELLRASGIPGIRYLDGGSRSGGKGTSNFVLFDDKLPKIIGVE